MRREFQRPEGGAAAGVTEVGGVLECERGRLAVEMVLQLKDFKKTFPY